MLIDMDWQFLFAGFDRFIFEYNEGIQHLGIFADDRYITGSAFIWNHLMSVILLIAFYELVLSNEKYQRHLQDIFENVKKVIIPICSFAIVSIFLYLVYMGAFAFLSVIMLIVIVLMKIYSDDKYRWLREKIDSIF